MPLGKEVGLGSGDIVLDGDPAPRKKAQQPATFRPMSIVAKRWPISATAELSFEAYVRMVCRPYISYKERVRIDLWPKLSQ